MTKSKQQTKVEVVPIEQLIADPGNVRLHPDRSKDALSKSVEVFGAARSVVADKDGVVRAGNGTLEAARAAGIKEAIVIEADGKQLVVVKRPDWTNEQAIAYAIADNRTGELSKFDYEGLQKILPVLAAHGMPVIGYDQTELEMFLKADWMPKDLVDIESYQRAKPEEQEQTTEGLVLHIRADHVEEVFAAIKVEFSKGAQNESEALISIIRRAK
jgi:hypothetical protein